MKIRFMISALAIATSAIAFGDSFTFTSGEKIALFDSNKDELSYVTLQKNVKCDGTVYEMAQSANGDAPIIVVSLNNAEAGDYLFYFKGTSKNAAATYTATITGATDTSSYTRTLTGSQAQTADWGIDAYGTDHWCYVDSLPAGKFTLTFTVACSNGWKGHYGNFTFTKVGGTFKVADYTGSSKLDLGTPSTDSNDRFGSQTLESWVTLVRADSAHNRLLLETDGYTLGSTKHGDTVTFYCKVDAKATYRLCYRAGTASGNTGVSIAWSLWNATTDTEVYSSADDVVPNDDNQWTLSNDYTDSFGILAAGTYILKATVQRPTATTAWACNFGNFSFSQSSTLELDGTDGTTIELDEDSTDREVVVSNNPTVDLKGHDLTLDVATTTFSGTLAVTNSDTEDTSVLTLKGAVTTAWLQSITVSGNVRLVIDGNAANDDPKFATKDGTANTHTGGTVFMNQTRRVYSYGITANCGTGALGFAGGAFLFVPSSSLFDGFGTINNDVEVSGTGNRLAMEGEAYGTRTFNFNGAFSGDGELYMFNGWQPDIHFNAAGNDGFTGTLYLAYCRNASQGFFVDGNCTGFANATVCLTNKLTSTDTPCTHVTFQQTADTVSFGHLITDAEEAIAHTNTQLIANHTGTTTLRVGSLGKSGSFAGAFVEQSGKTFKVVKEGAGAWTLAGTKPSSISGGIDVDGGALYLDTTFSAATTVNVNDGGSFYGAIPENVTVVFNSGAVVDGDTLHTITGDVDLSNAVVTVADAAQVTDGFTFLSVAGSATGTPQLSAALQAVSTYNGHSGRWSVAATTANGVTSYSFVWRKSGFSVILR